MGFNYDELEESNPELFWDGVGRGKIPVSEISSLSMGTGVTSQFAEQFVGGPHEPYGATFDYTSQNPIGGSGVYPRPWLSYSQKQNNNTYTYAGAYGRMIGFKKDNCSGSGCIESKCCGSEGDSDPSQYNPSFEGIWGRMGIVLSGTGINERAFMPQNWHEADGPAAVNTVDFWNDVFEFGDGQRWPSKQDWWGNNTKAIVGGPTEDVWLCNASGASLGQKVKIQVVYGAPAFDHPGYFRGAWLGAMNALSVSMLDVMVALAAVRRW